MKNKKQNKKRDLQELPLLSINTKTIFARITRIQDLLDRSDFAVIEGLEKILRILGVYFF